VGAFTIWVVVHVLADGSYRPPVLVEPLTPFPPQTIIEVPLQIAVWRERPDGAPATAVGVQLSDTGS
jgi:hypothetical protein